MMIKAVGVSEAERRVAFMLELRELTRKHGVSIDGCGCCGSPWLDVDVDVCDERSGYVVGKNGDGLRWVTPGDAHYLGAVVRPK